MRRKLGLTNIFLSICLVLVLFAQSVNTSHARSIIRDTEIENMFDLWFSDIYKAADMDPGSVNIVLVQSSQVNAFVAGGANIFFFTGLLQKTDDPGEVIGVFAHELAHITGGHLIRGRDAMERASFESILGVVLGIGAAIATGDGAAASAVIAGSSNVAARNFLAHSRVNEAAADQAALSFLEDAKMDASGMVTFLQKLESEELLPPSQQSEYVRTHPITANRVKAAAARAESSVFINKGFPSTWVEQHARMKAKLLGFISPERVNWVYNDRDTSMPARYARTIAAYRQNNVQEAISSIDALIKDEPDNPYFHELKGQMLVDFGRVDSAIPYYEKAVEILPNAGLLRIALGHAYIESNNTDNHLQKAIDNLKQAVVLEPRSARVFRLLATAHGRMGREDIAKLHLAEEAVLQRNFPYAKRQAEAALQTLKEGSREWIKANDILAYVKVQKGLKN